MQKITRSVAATMISGLLFAVAPIAQACDNATLNGIYSVAFSGYVGSRPLEVSGVLVANGAGGFEGTISESLSGSIVPNQSVIGSYSINTGSCLGTGFISNSYIGTVNFNFAPTKNGKYFSGVEIDGGTSVGLTAKR